MGEQGIPLIKKWTALGKLDFSNPVEVPATESSRRIPLLSGIHSTELLGSSRSRIQA